MSMSRMTKAELVQQFYDDKGTMPPKSMTKADLIAALRGKPAPRSGGNRSAALSQPAPTVRMRVDPRDLQPQRRPGSADILAVALVVFLALLAAGGTTLEKLRKPQGQTAPALHQTHLTTAPAAPALNKERTA